jgi:hypothetical protein
MNSSLVAVGIKDL